MPDKPAAHGGPKCGAKKKQGTGACTQAAGWGTDHPGTGKCKLHGGGTRNHRTAAVDAEARAQLARLQVTPVDDPLSALAEIAGEVVAWKDAIAEKVNDLSSIRYSTEGGEQLRAEVAVWERALDRCERFLGTMAKLKIDERLARISETQAEVITKAVTAALAELGLAPDVQGEARRRVAHYLRAVPGGRQAG